MSEFLLNLATYLRERRTDPRFHIVSRSGDFDEDSQLPQALPQLKEASATVVEGATLELKVIGASHGSGFTHFLDGIERTHMPFREEAVPVLYGYTSAVVRTRDQQRKMRTWRKPAIDESLYFPFACVDRIDKLSLHPVDTYPNEEQVDEHPDAIKQKAKKALQARRSRLEFDLAQEWISAHPYGSSEWLMRDGSLSDVLTSNDRVNVVGVIKSHQTQYFRLEDQRKVLSLMSGHRTSVFAIKGYNDVWSYSWYLRLHPNTGRDIYFGLIRVEAAPVPETIQMADEISRWLLAERSPLALPDSRWDRLMYPIRDCEQYLRSIAPTRVMLEAAFSGL